jgi:glycosyltransferase involved in cell wall biosynthesis
LRIAYLCHDPLPHTSTSTEQVVRACSGLARAGVRVDLVFRATRGVQAPRPEAVAAAYGFDEGLPGGLRLVPLEGGDRLPGALGTAAWEARAARAACAADYDLVCTRDLLALAWSLAIGSRCVFETYRADLQAAPLLAPWRFFSYHHPNLAGVIVHSALTGRAAVAAGLPPRKLLVAYNGFAREHFDPRLERAEARTRLGLPNDRPLVVYAGHVGRRKGFDAILRLASAVPEASFLVLGIDAGSGERGARADARRAGAGNLLLHPRVAPPRVPPYLFAADCLLIPTTAGPLVRHRRTVLPMKTFLYLAAGRPILGPDLPDLREVLTDGETALLVPPDDPAAAASALRRLLADEGLRARLSAGALAAGVAYTWESRSVRVKEFLEAVSAAPAVQC